MDIEKVKFDLRKMTTYLTSFLKHKYLYSFSELLQKVKNKFPEINNPGVKLNDLIQSLEEDNVLFRVVIAGKPFFLSTEFFEERLAEVEWQNNKKALIYLLDEKRNKTGEISTLSPEESECVISGDIVKVKKIPDDIPCEDRYMLIERVDKATASFIAKVVEIERIDDKLVSKCVLLEKNFRLPIVLDVVDEDHILPYFEGDFIRGIINSESEFRRGKDINIELAFQEKIGNISDPQIETKLAIVWMDIERDDYSLSDEEKEDFKMKNEKVDADREDMTLLNFFSVDSQSSKDLDDAIFIRKEKDGFLAYVAISDVSYFIDKGGKLDKLVDQRDQSYYFPHDAYHMLPHEMSLNGLSLLQDGQNKKALVLKAKIDFSGNIVSYEFVEGLIKNKARLTYNDIEYYAEKNSVNYCEMLYDKKAKKEFLNEDDFITTDQIDYLLELAATLKSSRKENLDFYPNDHQLVLDGITGKVKSLKIDERTSISKSAIEELMLVANKCAADLMFKNGSVNGVYRNQSAPLKEGASLSKAQYENESKGHYSLNFENYTHFTSPMRRSVDLKVHREIKSIIKGLPVDQLSNLKEKLLYTNKVSRRFKQAQEKANMWLLIDFLKGLHERYFKAKIVKSLNNSWIVEFEKIDLTAQIIKPKDENEVKYIEEKGTLTICLHELNFCKEKIYFKIKSDKII